MNLMAFPPIFQAGNNPIVTQVAAYIGKAASTSNDLPSLVARSSAALTQLTATLEQQNDNVQSDSETYGASIIDESRSASTCLRELRAFLQRREGESEAHRMDGKLRRLIEKCRKACIKGLSRIPSGSRARVSIREVCESLNSLLSIFADAESTVALLDTLFQLATVGLNPSNADACDRAYAYLVDAERRIQQVASSSSSVPVSDNNDPTVDVDVDVEKKTQTLTLANYTRCLAGAFANVAGMLYKAERHSFVIRFLLKACALSARATVLYNECCKRNNNSRSESDAKGKAKAELVEKDVQAWKTHRMQSFRRWELLGVCYSKTGDRKVRVCPSH